ncbi:response regulator [Segnochrobactrum spirostomi]|uniref:Regulatory protein VirG n=1 Tax=Segnochrobactrum spirostomi TaxID=2608987 RepID=A0A6A7Y1E9_9HYPH|nr:response regulator [Segnochrobactrum spirostomi]MQT12207.1 response regulator [Segnochrobactrum spirostomi]
MNDPERDTEHILVVDDDARVRQMLSTYFEDEGFRVSAVADGAAMRECLQGTRVDLILLDLVLPKGEDGLGLAREIRARSTVPIIMLTGRGDVVDRIVGLEVGADDYIAKPFHLREVLARVRTVLRRHQPAAAPAAAPVPADATEVFRFDGWSFDLDRRKLTAADGTDVVLTTGEFDILAIFVKHPGRVFARETLMNLTRGRKLEVFDRTIDAQIARLRKKIEVDSKNPALIKSVRGVGYVFTGRSGG